MNSACTINVNIIRIIYNLLIKNIIDMSVDTVNTIVDITTLAQVQNELTNLAAPADVTGTVSCTADAMTGCKDANNTCSGACTDPTPVVAPTGTDPEKKVITDAVTAAWAVLVTAKTNMYCVPAAGGMVTIAAVDPVVAYKVNCPASGSAMFLKAVSSVVAATMVMHLA